MRNIILWGVLSYLIGSFPTGYVITKLFHKDADGRRDNLDIRTIGSGAIGATNVGRAMGFWWARFTALADMFKGAAALLAAVQLVPEEQQNVIMAVSALAVVIGHNYPVWLKFRGGKGIATTYGTLFFLWPYKSFAVVLFCGGLWYIIMKATRYVSVASMLSLLAMPVCFWMLGAPQEFVMIAGVLALMSVWRHRTNLVRLWKGTENRLK